jgi:hypothetical protein
LSLSRLIICALVGLIGCGAFASADTLRCQTRNGNTTCAGSSGFSCQTVNGQKTCVSGQGDVVQSIGNPHAMPSISPNDMPQAGPAVQRWLKQHGVLTLPPGAVGSDDDD